MGFRLPSQRTTCDVQAGSNKNKQQMKRIFTFLGVSNSTYRDIANFHLAPRPAQQLYLQNVQRS